MRTFILAALAAISLTAPARAAAPADSTRFHPPTLAALQAHQRRDELILGLGLLAAGVTGLASTHYQDKATTRETSDPRRSVNWRFAAWGTVTATGFTLIAIAIP